jgi:hypothetical protein
MVDGHYNVEAHRQMMDAADVNIFFYGKKVRAISLISSKHASTRKRCQCG